MNTHRPVAMAAENIIEAFANHQKKRYFDAFADHASFVFYNLAYPLTSKKDYHNTWSIWEMEHGFHVMACQSTNPQIFVCGSTAIYIHEVATTLQWDGQIIHNEERESIILDRQPDGSWLCIHEHLSPKI
ncbi:nuclear transport factor 2 family protein [Snodgrassella sp. CFCC 13594]|uniref:YybH family protein n=1 Tax=Snodgrassella sp. CFCC 13594 TaxID=1775559 RepID=UPI00082B790F|nr:nuclear transport factor 2 family protein [Snodgrassella sp. CFCC 13594]